MDEQRISALLKAMAHPVRIRILRGLRKNEDCSVNDMVGRLRIPQSTLSQHLGVLRNRQIIAPSKEGVRTCYRITDSRVLRLLDLFGKTPKG